MPEDKAEVMFVISADNTIVITTSTAVRAMLGKPNGPLLPLVWEDFEDTSISEALEHVATSSGYNVVVDPQVHDKVQIKATARLRNVPTDTAVRLLAAMADVSVVQMDNVFFLTTADKAKQLRQEQPPRAGQRPAAPTRK
jgi:type II secretory pathway component HofQ